MPKNKIRGVIKKKEVIVIDDDSDDDGGYDTDDSELMGMPKLVVKTEYDSSDDDSSDDESEEEDDDVSPQEDEATEIEAEANSGRLSPDAPLGRGLRVRKKRTHHEPQSSEFTNPNVTNVRNNVGHFQGLGVLNLSYRGQRYHLK